VPLQERTNLANDYTAAAFVSLHTNASPDSKAEGVETYVLDNSGDEATKSLAERENSVLELEGAADLQFILSDLIQTSKAPDSFALAAAVQESLVSMIGKRYQAPRNLGVRKAPFYVLVGAHMPCILVELSFIDHEREGELLASRRYREVLGESVARGIAKYFGFEE
jgi:N-acetylmuramoyl-L-alanine amidase